MDTPLILPPNSASLFYGFKRPAVKPITLPDIYRVSTLCVPSPESGTTTPTTTTTTPQAITSSSSSSSSTSTTASSSSKVSKSIKDYDVSVSGTYSNPTIIESKVRPAFIQQYKDPWNIRTPGTIPRFEKFINRSDDLANLASRLEISTKPICRTCVVLGPSGIGKTTFINEFVRQEKEKGECLVFRIHAHSQCSLTHGFKLIGDQLNVDNTDKSLSVRKKIVCCDDDDYAVRVANHLRQMTIPWLLVIYHPVSVADIERYLPNLSSTASPSGRIILIAETSFWRQYLGSIVQLGTLDHLQIMENIGIGSEKNDTLVFNLYESVFQGNFHLAKVAHAYVTHLKISYADYYSLYKSYPKQSDESIATITSVQRPVLLLTLEHIKESDPIAWTMLLCFTYISAPWVCESFVNTLHTAILEHNPEAANSSSASPIKLLETLQLVQKDDGECWMLSKPMSAILQSSNLFKLHTALFTVCANAIVEERDYIIGCYFWSNNKDMLPALNHDEAATLALLQLTAGLAGVEAQRPSAKRCQEMILYMDTVVTNSSFITKESYIYIILQLLKLKISEELGIVKTTDAIQHILAQELYTHDQVLASTQRSLDFVQQLHGSDDHSEVVTCMNHMASMQLALGRFEQGLEQYNDMIKLTKGVHGTEYHPDVAYAMSQAACVLQSLGRYSESLVQHQKVLEIRRKIYGTEEHPNVAVTMHVIGTVLSVLKRYKEAMVVHRRTLAIWRKIFDDDAHSEIASSLSSIGGILQGARKYQEALEIQRECLAVQRQIYGTDETLEIATTLSNIAESLRLLGQYKEAFSTIQEALSLRLKIHGTDVHVDVASSMSCIASILQSLGRYDEALYHQQKTLEQYCRIYNTEEHLDVAITRSYIAKLYDLLDRHEEALTECEKTLELRIKIHGTKVHLDVAASMSHMASVLQKLGRFEEALELQFETLELFHEIYNTDCHPDYANTMSQINGVLEDLMEYERALKGHRKTLALWRKIYQTDEHPEVSTGIGEIANVLSSLGRDEEALLEYEHSLLLERRIYGTDEHQEICLSLTNTAVTMRKLNMAPELHLALDRNAWMFLPTDHPDYEKRRARFEKRHAKAVQKIQKEMTKQSNQTSIPACKLRAQLSALDLLRESTFQLGHDEFTSIITLYLKNSKKKAKNFYLTLANETTIMFVNSLMNAGAFQQASEVLLSYVGRLNDKIGETIHDIVVNSFAQQWFGTADKMLFATGYLLLSFANQRDAM
eukprot:TRINITY_DN798_c0_g1_i22.p1 TRINITY_DN798_c0_g1~~TRINITY_DN798_c0_g1_i22.p1  ORF type:complete len:1242 (+),score=288.32 TRINITY_DN798_c0_g1_i22:92-3817(+)